MWIKDKANSLIAGARFQSDAREARAVSGSDLVPESDDPQGCARLRLGNIWLAQPLCAAHQSQCAGSGAAGIDDSGYMLVFPSKAARLRVGNIQRCFQPGEPFLYRAGVDAVLVGQEVLTISIPTADLQQKLPALQRTCPLALNPASPVVQMLWRYCSDSLALGQCIGERQGQLFSEQIVSLLNLELITVLNGAENNGCDMTAVHRGRIFDLINAEYGNAEFSLTRLAIQLHLSRRYVQRILARHGTSFSDYLRTVRLEAAAVQLSHAQPPLKLAQLAEDCGFRSQSSFNRAFKRHFGLTPRAYHAEVVAQRELQPL
ncbi:AraC family transcriptional regulator [Marinobacterium arenosum]|uniref:AraC family transcriptional regulator n=1 Tax=Marinobacterium arenosum TaxID=2862496 RepID=UPI001C9735A7|nr:AraC family transcriptional regulator [Marinobacterium arenosum]MBY4675179.1 helix-turn-helix transcriptional regulator [Marinobacterium arenosum]